MFLATGKGSSTSSTHWPQPCHHFEFPDILLATDNFNESLVIGRGGFGKVYKGTILIEPSPVVAAIKRLDSTSNQGATEFWAEVEMLSKLRHCHLVSLLGYCNDGNEMILVYEYMPHGTLEDHLHKHNTPLSWLQRLQICIGAARGLDYLHTGTGIELGVIHRDVKSSNILLHESWAAKISDFGLSRIGPKNRPTTYVNTIVKGTFGYLDPDYFRTGRLTRKSDVYAFGIVLFEVLCRKRAVDGSLHEEEWGLARWAQDSIKEGGLKQIIDYDMRNQISPKCLKEFARIANRCLHDHPRERPTMAEVVFTLESVLALQEKANISLQNAGKTIFSRMVDVLPFPSKGEHSGDVDSKPSSLQVFKFADLKRATSDFSLHMLLRDDGLRKVFLGWVDKETLAPSSPDTGMSVAIKRCSHENSQGHTEWLAEVSFLLLGQLAHPNIISLLGYCDNDEEKLLVYENMHNRSFDFFLFPNASVIDEPLSWGTRLNIMMGVARGLTYLHSSQVQLIHRDVKSSNVFLDQDFNAKLGHFGVAAYSNVIGGATHVGSLGYVDPEYFMTGDLSVKSDVFSFGVVLLETLTGQRPLSTERPEEHRNLAMWVCLLAKEGESEQIMDPRLEQNYPKEGALKCIELAVSCLHLNRNERPSSEEVLRSLEAISALTSNGQ